ncbi:MAG: LysR substrate-binding domain-containing protein [Salinivirgaceae bacterium]|jgi:LysR family hydrogen peroxide-inducible transcriptional activator|nr:LysR substrate-binding domain-containing protein [Salinivirgaceae bacterium]
MTLIQLEYIIAVDAHRHFVSAAEHCHVTQPTLSMQIKKLEEELEVLIFDRNKQPIEPTAIGKRIIDQARTILKGKSRISELISDTRDDLSGEVKIGIIPTIASYLVPLFIPKLVKKYPELKVYIEELMTHEVIEKMNQGQIDLGIVSTPVGEDGLNELPVYFEAFELFISENHKLAAKTTVSSRDLNLDEMWLLTDGHCFRNHVINLCGEQHYYPKKLKFGYKTGSLEVLMRFVEQNHGYTLLPHLATLNIGEERKKNIRSFKEPTPKREISIITSEGYLKEKLIEAISKEIRLNIPKEMKHLDNGKIINWKN